MMTFQKMPTVLGIAALCGVLAGTGSTFVHAEGKDHQVVLAGKHAQVDVKNYLGERVNLDKNKVTHLVFMDLWEIYEGKGVDTDVAALPESFLKSSQQVWVQPEINVTRAQLAEFQQYYPQVKPLVLDDSFTLFRANGVWQSPYHVLIKDGGTVFSGNLSALRRFLNVDDVREVDGVNDKTASQQAEVSSSVSPVNRSASYMKLKVGDTAPAFSGETLSGAKKSLHSTINDVEEGGVSLVFLDSLCPMPHFPQCETKLAALNQKINEDPQRTWLGVVNSFYVDADFARQFAERFDLRLPLIFDQGNQIFSQYGVHATPYQVDVSRNGVVEYRGEHLQ